MKPAWKVAAAIILVGLLLAALDGVRLWRKTTLTQPLTPIAQDLMETQSSPMVVYVGEATQSKLATLPRDATITVLSGDAPNPIGDRTADARILYYGKDGGALLGLRMKWNANQQKFDILGFWTPR